MLKTAVAGKTSYREQEAVQEGKRRGRVEKEMTKRGGTGIGHVTWKDPTPRSGRRRTRQAAVNRDGEELLLVVQCLAIAALYRYFRFLAQTWPLHIQAITAST